MPLVPIWKGPRSCHLGEMERSGFSAVVFGRGYRGLEKDSKLSSRDDLICIPGNHILHYTTVT